MQNAFLMRGKYIVELCAYIYTFTRKWNIVYVVRATTNWIIKRQHLHMSCVASHLSEACGQSEDEDQIRPNPVSSIYIYIETRSTRNNNNNNYVVCLFTMKMCIVVVENISCLSNIHMDRAAGKSQHDAVDGDLLEWERETHSRTPHRSIYVTTMTLSPTKNTTAKHIHLTNYNPSCGCNRQLSTTFFVLEFHSRPRVASTQHI